MEDLRNEGKALYELLQTESAAVYQERFLVHKKEVLDAMRLYIASSGRWGRTSAPSRRSWVRRSRR
jgi:hypothetical protein